jgi:hypothetical protein
LARFPFLILFRVEDDVVIVLGVFHAAAIHQSGAVGSGSNKVGAVALSERLVWTRRFIALSASLPRQSWAMTTLAKTSRSLLRK